MFRHKIRLPRNFPYAATETFFVSVVRSDIFCEGKVQNLLYLFVANVKRLLVL